MARTLIGPRIRDRRRLLGITQAGLANRVGISASYLNLIEGNKRNIAGALLRRIADELGLGVDEVDGAAERRLLADLGELAAEPLLAALRLDRGAADDLAGRHPGWGRALVTLHRAWLDGNRAVGALSDRLNQDPFLGDAVHRILTQVAAIRSSAEILETVDDLEPAQRARFVAIIGAESARLSDVAQALAAFFDRAHTRTRSVTPVEEVDDFLFDRGNHFPALERVAEAFRAAAGIDGDCDERVLADYLRSAHGVRVEVRPGEGLAAPEERLAAAFGGAAPSLVLADTALRPTRRFLLARAATRLFDGGAAVAAEVAAAGVLSSEAARRRAERVLDSYLAGAALLPYDRFHAAAEGARYDIEVLCQRFAASFEQACHRLATLRRPGAAGIPFGFMRVDAAGFVTKRLPLPHLPLPRHGNACPLWAVYEAFQSPGRVVRQLAAFPTGERFLFVARTVEKRSTSFALPRRLLSVLLACDALHADRTVYGDGLDLSSVAPAVPVGPNCRVCARRDCAYREEDPIIDA